MTPLARLIQPTKPCHISTVHDEAVDAGTVKLVGADPAVIVEATRRLPDDPVAYETIARDHNPYGDGQAALRIRDLLKST
jgi:UDP-N-acetylglucosamine 2-epimerase (non-hydrolysing)